MDRLRQHHAAEGRARHQRRLTGRETASIDRMEAVDILRGIDRLDHSTRVDMLWQWELHQNAVDVVTLVERAHDVEQLRLTCRLR